MVVVDFTLLGKQQILDNQPQYERIIQQTLSTAQSFCNKLISNPAINKVLTDSLFQQYPNLDKSDLSKSMQLFNTISANYTKGCTTMLLQLALEKNIQDNY